MEALQGFREIDQRAITHIGLTSLEIAGLLSVLRVVQLIHDSPIDFVSAHLRQVIERGSGIGVHDDGVESCISELGAELVRGSDLVQVL